MVLEEGFDDVQLSITKKCHYAVECTLGDDRAKLFFGGTPSDWRALKNFRSQLRHVHDQMQRGEYHHVR